MNKTQLVDKIAESADISKASAGRALDAFIETVQAPQQARQPLRRQSALRCQSRTF